MLVLKDNNLKFQPLLPVDKNLGVVVEQKNTTNDTSIGITYKQGKLKNAEAAFLRDGPMKFAIDNMMAHEPLYLAFKNPNGNIKEHRYLLYLQMATFPFRRVSDIVDLSKLQPKAGDIYLVRLTPIVGVDPSQGKQVRLVVDAAMTSAEIQAFNQEVHNDHTIALEGAVLMTSGDAPYCLSSLSNI